MQDNSLLSSVDNQYINCLVSLALGIGDYMNEETIFQLAHSICNMQDLAESLELSTEEMARHDKKIRITPYILQAIKNGNLQIRRQFIPFSGQRSLIFEDDYLQEESYSPVEDFVHRYKNKAIYIATDQCACFCQFCTRQRVTQCSHPYKDNLEEILEYLRKHKEINDLLITGGDPLILDTSRISRILEAVSSLQHIKVIRIGTRVPITLPMRIDAELLDALGKYNNLYINIHINHISELTSESRKAIVSLANKGIPLGSQTVFMAGINNNEIALRELFSELVSIKVKPYYLYQCDKVKGCEEYVADVLEGIRIINSLCNTMSGFAIPKFVVDTPELGKMVLAPCSITALSDGQLRLASPQGECNYSVTNED